MFYASKSLLSYLCTSTGIWTREEEKYLPNSSISIPQTWSLLAFLFQKWCCTHKTCSGIIYSLCFWNSFPVSTDTYIYTFMNALATWVSACINILCRLLKWSKFIAWNTRVCSDIMIASIHVPFFNMTQKCWLFRKGVSQDPSKPIFIPHGADTFDQIWPGCNPAQFSMEYFKHIFETSIGKYDEKLSIPDDPAEDPNFREAEIDSRRNVILEDLTLTESIRKEYYKGDSIRMANWLFMIS